MDVGLYTNYFWIRFIILFFFIIIFNFLPNIYSFRYFLEIKEKEEEIDLNILYINNFDNSKANKKQTIFYD